MVVDQNSKFCFFRLHPSPGEDVILLARITLKSSRFYFFVRSELNFSMSGLISNKNFFLFFFFIGLVVDFGTAVKIVDWVGRRAVIDFFYQSTITFFLNLIFKHLSLLRRVIYQVLMSFLFFRAAEEIAGLYKGVHHQVQSAFYFLEYRRVIRVNLLNVFSPLSLGLMLTRSLVWPDDYSIG